MINTKHRAYTHPHKIRRNNSLKQTYTYTVFNQFIAWNMDYIKNLHVLSYCIGVWDQEKQVHTCQCSIFHCSSNQVLHNFATFICLVGKFLFLPISV